MVVERSEKAHPSGIHQGFLEQRYKRVHSAERARSIRRACDRLVVNADGDSQRGQSMQDAGVLDGRGCCRQVQVDVKQCRDGSIVACEIRAPVQRQARCEVQPRRAAASTVASRPADAGEVAGEHHPSARPS